MKNIVVIIGCIIMVFSCTYHEKKQDSEEQDRSVHADVYIAGHLGQDTVWGNFTGYSIDTIWVETRIDSTFDEYYYQYYAVSNNPLLPKFELDGRYTAYLVKEGDLDGDGKEELGWMRCFSLSYSDTEYHLLHFEKDCWVELVDEDGALYWFTGRTRHAGIDLISKGPVAGSLIISYLFWQEHPTCEEVVKSDTIWKPRYQKVPIIEFYE